MSRKTLDDLLAAIYARISEDKKGEEAGVTRQLGDGRTLAKTRGIPVAQEFVDNDLSATTGGPRPDYQKLVRAVERGEINVVIVWHLSRLWRNRAERAAGIEVFKRQRVRILCVKGPDLDLSTAYGRGMAGLLGEFDTMEVEIKGERTQSAQLQKVQAGGWIGGTRPFGWRVDGGKVRRHQREAAAVRRAIRAVLAGESLASIIRDFEKRGITATTGRPFSYATLRQMLTRPRNAGIVEYGGEPVGTWPALVSEDEWRACKAILDDPERRKSQSNRPKWLLSGILHCVCGEPMRVGSTRVNRKSTATRPVYRCYQTGRGQHASPDAHLLDVIVGGGIIHGQQVTGLVGVRLSRRDAVDLLAGTHAVDDVRDLNAEAVSLREDLDEIARMKNRGEITLSQVPILTAGTRERLQAVEVELEAVDRGNVLGDIAGKPDATERFQRFPLSRQRAIVRELFDELTVLPVGRGNRFDPKQHLRYRWKGQE